MNRLITFIIFTLIMGCASKDPYRTQSDQFCHYEKTGDCHDQAMTIANSGTDQEYRLSFFEYDDQGMPHFPDTIKKIIQSYRGIASKQEIMLITFIHGWKHNAEGEDEDSNIVEFREVLSKAAQSTPGKKVLGVYVGWRGRSIDIDYLDNITFWDRKNTAHEVGQQGVTEALLELENISKANHNNGNRMITIGHSFGGAALFSSINLVMAERYVSSRPHPSTDLAGGFGDLVVLLNPAFEALRYSSLFELSQDECRTYPEEQRPKLIILSSEDDTPVHTIFPMGRTFNAWLEAHRKANATHCIGERSIPCPVTPSATGSCLHEFKQYRADRTAVGHFEPYITHKLYSADNVSSFTRPESDKDIKTSWMEDSKQGYVYFNRTALISNNISKDYNPYMNIHTDGNVMSGHNDIWTREVLDFVNEIIKLTAQ